MSLSAATLRHLGLEPQMDVIALGEAEHDVFYNPATPERDSLLELLPAIAAVDRQLARDFAQLVDQAQRLNGRQTTAACQVAGLLDRMATDLRASERGQMRQALAAKSLARALRPHLRTIADAERFDIDAIRALREVDRVTNGIGRDQILSPAVRHELGKAPYALLCELVDPQEVPA